MPHKVCTVAVRLAAWWNRSLDYRHARFTLESRINKMVQSCLILQQVFTVTLLGVSQSHLAVFILQFSLLCIYYLSCKTPSEILASLTSKKYSLLTGVITGFCPFVYLFSQISNGKCYLILIAVVCVAIR